MTFTKTSQKFGQWSDVRANTVYGLGFSGEAELNKVLDNTHETSPTSHATSLFSSSRSLMMQKRPREPEVSHI